MVCIVGTGGDDGNDSSNVASLSRMDLSGAKALVIASKNTNGTAAIYAASEDTDVLYKLTEDGLLIEVKFYDDSGNEVSSDSYLPKYIEDINDDYVFMTFQGGPWPNQYIVQKSTGFTFQMQNEAGRYFDVLNHQHYFHSEDSGDTFDGNAYYLCHNELRRIEFNSSGTLVDTRVSAVGDTLSHDETLGPMTAIAADGTILYNLYKPAGADTRLITKDGQVVDLLQEIIQNQPEMRQFLLGEIPGYIGGFGVPFIGIDGEIYFINDNLLNYLRNELYFVPQYSGDLYPDSPPEPSGPTISVFTQTDISHTPFNPYTDPLEAVNLRNPISVRDGGNWWEIDYVYPEDWDWYPQPYESLFQGENLTDQFGNDPGWRYDEDGNPYRWHWYDGEIFYPVWHLSTSDSGGFQLKPYGGAMATSSRWLLDKAPAGNLYYDPKVTEQRRTKWERVNNALRLRCNDKIIIIEVPIGMVYEVNNPTNRAKPVDLASQIFSEITDAKATADYYFLLGRTKSEAQICLFRFDADTHSPFKLIDGGEYELYTFTVTNENSVFFKAVRKSDGASIGGTINLAGEITILEALQDRNIVQLVRVL